MPTALQIKLIHVAHKQAGLSDADYRTILRNCGGATSCKDLDQRGYEDAMAVIEDCGFRERDKPGDYWRAKVAARGSRAGGRMAYKIHELALASRYDLAAMCRKFSADRAEEPEQLTPREAWKLIEMYKAAAGREARSQEPEAAKDEDRTPSRRGAEGNPDGSLFPSTPSELCASAPLRSIPPVEPAAVEFEDDVPF
jgi:hypothetical protein